MRISWVLSDTAVINPVIDLERLKAIGPFWGGWRTWRSYATDNVVCHTESEAQDLVNRSFHTRCNLHVPNSAYQSIGRPTGIKLYQGDFHEMIDHPDEIVSMHLSAAHSDIVLLVGFDVSLKNLDDRLAKHKRHNYIQYFYHIVVEKPEVQWVILDHQTEVEHRLKKVPNLQFDTLENVLAQFQ